MKAAARLKYLLASLALVIIVFVVVSLADIVIAVLYARFYSTAAFLVTFGVGGIFGGVLAFMQGWESATEKNEFTRWSLIVLVIICGLVFFFPLARIEGGEYKAAFKAYGATMALSTLLFILTKMEEPKRRSPR